MGQVIETLQTKLKRDKTIRIIIRGLNDSGKTTILYWLKENKQLKSIIPTIGINVEQLKNLESVFEFYDIGLEDINSTNMVWSHYYKNARAVIYVVDIADKQRIQEVNQDLQQLSKQQDLKNKPFLIFANKIDKLNYQHVSEFDVIQDFNLNQFKQYFVQLCSGQTGEGIQEGFQSFIKQFKLK